MIIVVLQVFVIALVYFTRAYLSEKGKGLATKQDVAHLTASVEKVKSEFRVQEEMLRAALTHKTLIQRTRFELELNSYRDFWVRFLALEKALIELQSYSLTRHRDEATISELYDIFKQLRQQMSDDLEKVSPFIHHSVATVIEESLLHLRLLAVNSTRSTASTESEVKQHIQEWVAAAGVARSRLSSALSARLFSDPAVIASDAEHHSGAASQSGSPR